MDQCGPEYTNFVPKCIVKPRVTPVTVTVTPVTGLLPPRAVRVLFFFLKKGLPCRESNPALQSEDLLY